MKTALLMVALVLLVLPTLKASGNTAKNFWWSRIEKAVELKAEDRLEFNGGLMVPFYHGLKGGLRYCMLADRPVLQANGFVVHHDHLVDFVLGYQGTCFEINFAIGNLLNTRRNEVWIDESKLRKKDVPAPELNSIRTPVAIKVGLCYSF